MELYFRMSYTSWHMCWVWSGTGCNRLGTREGSSAALFFNLVRYSLTSCPGSKWGNPERWKITSQYCRDTANYRLCFLVLKSRLKRLCERKSLRCELFCLKTYVWSDFLLSNEKLKMWDVCVIATLSEHSLQILCIFALCKSRHERPKMVKYLGFFSYSGAPT